MSKYKRIFIVDHSGAGKGVVAQGIAKELGWKYLDADFALAPSIGRSLTEVLGNQGEQKFLQCLTDILTQQLDKENIVLLPVADRKAFLDKQHLERDSLFEEVATLTIEPDLAPFLGRLRIATQVQSEKVSLGVIYAKEDLFQRI